MEQMRTIRVTGKGLLKVRPDTTRVTLTLEGKEKEYSEVLLSSAQQSAELRDEVSALGFDPKALKTLDFSVSEEYERYEVKNTYRQRLVGYRFRHELKLEFPSDAERLGELLHALANCPVRPEFQISCTVGDPEAAKNQLLEKAVQDAQDKAQVLAGAAGLTLGPIRTMDYSWDELELEVQPMNRMMALSCPADSCKGFAMEMEPDDIDLSDTVTIQWSLL